MDNIRVLFLDDREIFKYGLYLLFKNDPEIEIIEADRKLDWFEIIEHIQPNILIIDIGYNGTTIVKEIKHRFEKLKIIALTNDPNDNEFTEILDSGVKAYLQVEDLTFASLKDAIKYTMNDIIVLTRHFSDVLYKYLIPKDVHSYDPMTMSREEYEESKKISNQEKAVIALILSGSSYREISKYLHISENTAKVHLRNLKNKLGVNPKQKLDSFFQYHRHVRSRMLLEYYVIKQNKK